MNKKIIVPLDGSERAEAILPYVEELAEKFGSEIVFVQIVEHPIIMTPIQRTRPVPVENLVVEELIQQATKYTNQLAKDFIKKGAKATAVVETGPIVHSILEIAEKENADLIAMASHGRTGLARVFYGSVAASMLQRVDRPLFLIRAEGAI